MPDFVWRAARADGSLCDGVMDAQSQSQVLQQLKIQGLIPVVVRLRGASESASSLKASGSAAGLVKSMPSLASLLGRAEGPAKSADVLLLTSELSVMLKAGLPLDTALRLLVGMTHKPSVSIVVQQVLENVKAGVPLSRALTRHQNLFGDFYINMVRSGEASGQLSAVFERLVEHIERLRALREGVVSAMIYPAILLGVALLSLVVMLWFVVPQFETLFKDMGDALPVPTRIVMALGQVFTRHGWLLLVSLLLLVWMFRRWARTPRGRSSLQRRAMAIPMLGPLLRQYDLTLFCRSLGTLLSNGVPLIDALHIATETVGSTDLRVALTAVPARVKAGMRLADALASSGVLDPLALNLVRVGGETGRMAPMFLELAHIYNRNVETGIKRGLTMLEPVLILVLGLLIAAIIVSILLGILSVNDLAT